MSRRREEKPPLPPGFVLWAGAELSLGDVIRADYQSERIERLVELDGGYWDATLQPLESAYAQPRQRYISHEKPFCTLGS